MEWMTWKEIGVLAVNEFGFFIICMLSSFFFVYLVLKVLCPKIEISPLIYKRTKNGETLYIFKVINKSIFNAYNVRFKLFKREPYIIDGSYVNHKLTEIELNRDEVFCVPRFQNKKGAGDFAILVGTKTNISIDMGVNNLEYELSVSLAHGLSNITKVFVMRYKNKANISSKPFVFGNNLKKIA
jgi:hypothetical protein